MNVALHAGVVLGHAFHQIPEVAQSLGLREFDGHRVHAHDGYAEIPQHGIVARQQVVLQEHDFRPHEIHLPAVLVDGVAQVGERGGRLALEHRPAMQQRQVVVVQNAEVGVTPAQCQLLAHHVDNTVGQCVQLAVRVAPLPLEVNQRLAISPAHCNLRHQAREVDLHAVSYRPRCTVLAPLRDCLSGACNIGSPEGWPVPLKTRGSMPEARPPIIGLCRFDRTADSKHRTEEDLWLAKSLWPAWG
ncbi:hypothetical protein D9M68_537350 [compost metagenome]